MPWKKGGSSWLTAVKRAFRSPTKEVDEDKKKREKRRWTFRKPTNLSQQESPKEKTENVSAASVATAEQRHALDAAVATAEAAMATAQAAAVEVARLTKPTNHAREQQLHFAAIVIQTSFRGYLARRALRALKGLVKLQALVRGHNVRKQAKMTLRCMQALVRVQARVLDQRTRLSHEGSRKSAFSDTNSNSAWESRYMQDISDRKSIQSREGSSIADDWDERPHTIEEVKAMLQHRKEAAMKREKALSHSFSQQIRRNGRSPSMGNEDELEEKPKWLDRWMAPNPWENSRERASTDHRDPIKTVEIDTSQPYSSLSSNLQRSNTNQYHHQQQQRPSSPLSRDISHQSPQQRPSSPLSRDRSHQSQQQRPSSPFNRDRSLQSQQQRPSSPFNRDRSLQSQQQRPSSPFNRDRSLQNQQFHHSPVTPSPSKARPPLQVQSASPRCFREDQSSTASQTPSLRSNYYYNGGVVHQHSRGSTSTSGGNVGDAALPNYMAATESAKARIRSQSAPRQRPSTPDRERGGVGSVKKRLSFPVPDRYGVVGMRGHGGGYEHSLRSPSFKSVVSGSNFGLEQQSNYSSCTESHGGEVSPSSTSDLRRWLR